MFKQPVSLFCFPESNLTPAPASARPARNLSVSVSQPGIPDQLYSSHWRSGYRQLGSLREECEAVSCFGPISHYFSRLRAKKSSQCRSGSLVSRGNFFLLRRWRLVVGGGEIFVSRGESGEDEGVNEGLRVVQSPQQGR